MDPYTRPVSPYSIRGIAQNVGGAYNTAVGAVSNLIESTANRFRRPTGYTPAIAPVPAPAPVAIQPVAAPVVQPAMQPAPTIGGAIGAIQAREQALANLADGGMVPRPHYRDGKAMLRGPGTTTSDSIPINASAGESVLPADTTQAIGGEQGVQALIDATHTPVAMQQQGGSVSRAARRSRLQAAPMANGGCVKRMADGGIVKPDENRPRRVSLVDQIPTGGLTAPAGQRIADDPLASSELGRNLANAAAAVAPQASGTVSRIATTALRAGAGAAANPVVTAAAPLTPVAGGAAALGAASAPAAAPVAAPAVPASQPAAPAVAPAAAAAPVGTAPAQPVRRYVDAQGNEVQPPQLVSDLSGAASTSADRIATMERAGQTYRDITAMQNAGGNQPASVMPDRQAERNAQFDREVLIDRANRIGGRGGRAILDLVASNARDAAATQGAQIRETGATQRTQIVDQGQTQRERETTASNERVQGPVSRLKAAETAVTLRGKAQLQAAQEAYQRAVAGGDADAIDRAEKNLRAAQGKWEKPEAFGAVAVPGGVDPATGLPGGSSVVVFNKATGEVSNTMPASQVRGAQPAQKYQTGQVYKDASGNRAKWDGTKFVPV